MEGHPNGTREVRLPGLREDHAATRTVPRHPARMGGPSFLAMLMFDKYGQHQPLHRQAERFACEGIPLSVSTPADQIGATCHVMMPIYRMIEAHVLELSVFMTTTGRCRSWPRVSPTPANYRTMWAMIGPSRLRCVGSHLPPRARSARRTSPSES